MDHEILLRIVLGIGGAIVAHGITVWLTGSLQRWTGATPQEWLYEPLLAEDLLPKHAKYFEQKTPEFAEHGFRVIGDYLVRRTPKLSTARCLLNDDGTVLGVIENYLGQQTFSCVSMLADGTYFETGASDGAPAPHPDVPMVLISADPQTVHGVVEQHRLVIADYCELHHTEPLPMAEDDFREVLLYGQRLVMRLCHAQGLLPELPAFAREKAANA